MEAEIIKRKELNRKPIVGQAKKQKRKEKDLCYNCGKSRYFARNYSQKKKFEGKPPGSKHEFNLAKGGPTYRQIELAEREEDWEEVDYSDLEFSSNEAEVLNPEQKSQLILEVSRELTPESTRDTISEIHEVWIFIGIIKDRRI